MKKIMKSTMALLTAVIIMTGLTTRVYAATSTSTLFPTFTLYVNRALDTVTVKLNNPDGTETAVKSMVCSTGRAGHTTPLGTFKTSDYYDWRLMVDGTYGRYAVRFNKGIMFHSVPYYTRNEGNLEYDQYNLLGQKASLGCVRLCVADAKWIYDFCKKGTKVVVYDDYLTPGELSKPSSILIDVNSPYRGWDPTDPSPLNPWISGGQTAVTEVTQEAVLPAQVMVPVALEEAAAEQAMLLSVNGVVNP